MMKTHNQANLLTLKNPLYREWVLQYTFGELKKDLGRGDATTMHILRKPRRVTARIFSRAPGVLAGRQEVEFFLKKRLCVKFLKRDGQRIRGEEAIALLSGDIREILKVERVTLNLLGRMSGVATQTSRIVEKVKKVNRHILITPTRKTLWGLLDKRACVLGGGGTHRLNLDNAILIKDNHLDAMGRDIEKAIKSFFSSGQKAAFFEIEVATSKEAKIACAVLAKLKKDGRCRIPCFVMLDNFSPKNIQKTLKILRAANFKSCAKIEASGGINEKNIRAYAKTGVDIISMGSLTHSAPMFNLSLEISSP